MFKQTPPQVKLTDPSYLTATSLQTQEDTAATECPLDATLPLLCGAVRAGFLQTEGYVVTGPPHPAGIRRLIRHTAEWGQAWEADEILRCKLRKQAFADFEDQIQDNGTSIFKKT